MDDKGKVVAITFSTAAVVLVVLSSLLMILLMIWGISSIIHHI